MGYDEKRIAVAHHDLVTLAYLVEIKIKRSAHEFAKHILYDKLNQIKFSKILPLSDPSKDVLIENSHVSSEDCSMNTFVAELEKEISVNQQAEVEYTKQQFERKVISFMQQLLFETSSISETNGCAKYKAELLKASDPDHQFVLGSMTKKKPNAKILTIFRINPVDGFEVKKKGGGFLYLRGVKSDELPKVLAKGYPASHEDWLKQCECLVGCCSCYASTLLNRELLHGTSHCITNGEVGKQSFVFVVRDGKSTDNVACLNSDTRGCCFKTGMAITHHPFGHIPAYLIVFSVQ